MINRESGQDFFKMQAKPTPHSIGCTVMGPEGETLYVGPRRWDKQVTDVHIYSDAALTNEALLIRSRRLLDVTLVYDVLDPVMNETVGTIRRMRHRSILCDEWALIEEDNMCSPGVVPMDCTGFAVMKRAFTGGYDNRFHIYIKGRRLGTIRECKGPRGSVAIETDFSGDTCGVLDRRLGVAAGVLLIVSDWL